MAVPFNGAAAAQAVSRRRSTGCSRCGTRRLFRWTGMLTLIHIKFQVLLKLHDSLLDERATCIMCIASG